MLRKVIALLILLAVLITDADAQFRRYKRRRKKVPKIVEGLSVYGKVGANYYFGDLVDAGVVRPCWSVGGEREMTNWMQVYADLDFGFLHGVQHSMYKRLELQFKTFYLDLGVGGKVSLLDLAQGYLKDRKWIPWFGIGPGVVVFNAKKTQIYGPEIITDKNDPNYDPNQQWLRSEEGFQVAAMVHGTIGVAYRWDKWWFFFFELRPVLPLSDDLDGHSGWYNGDSKRFISGDNDFYYTTMIGARYRFKEPNWYRNSKFNRKVYLKARRIYQKYQRRRRR